MKTTVDFYEFRRAFEQIRPDNFSREGLAVLFDYLDQWEANTGEELELDVIGFCCDFSEEPAEDIAANYSIDIEDAENPEEVANIVRDYLQDQGVYVGDVAEDDDRVSFVYRPF